MRENKSKFDKKKISPTVNHGYRILRNQNYNHTDNHAFPKANAIQ